MRYPFILFRRGRYGHKGIFVLQRYLHQTHQDTEEAQRRAIHVEVGLHDNLYT